MSLFKLREWWTANLGESELDLQFGGGSFCSAALFPNDAHKGMRLEQLIVGSFNGTLSVLDPSQAAHPDPDEASASNNSAIDMNYRPEHLLIEEKFDRPILQVLSGQFVRNMELDTFAVLHDRKLAVYALQTTQSAQVQHGSTFSLRKAYEHNLQRSAYNMTKGPFGNIEGRDFICVQSLDGTLSFFEHETFAFSRFLPGSLLPGPLIYQILAVAADSKSKDEANNMSSGKKVSPDWQYEIGEMALDMNVVEISPAQPSIVVLGERSLHCFTQGGTLRFMRKFAFSAQAFTVYSTTSEGFLQYMIVTDTKTLMFFFDTTLKWTVQLPFTPVAIKRTTLSATHRGLISILDHMGQLTIGYLGTDPALFGLPQTDTRHIDYAQRHNELKQLQAAIKNSKSADIKMSSRSTELRVQCIVPDQLDAISNAYDTQVKDDDVPSVSVKIVMTPSSSVSNVQIFIHTSAPIVAHQNAFSFAEINGKEEVVVSLFANRSCLPSSLSAACTVVYSNVQGSPRCTHATFDLPLLLITKNEEATKSAVHKITIETSHSVVPLTEIFPEFMMEPTENAGQSLGFRFVADASITGCVLASKNTQKYRVQTDTFEFSWILLSELLRRLTKHHAKDSTFRLSYSGELPLTQYFALLDRHFELYKRSAKLEAILASRCAQLRTVQKQLLTKFKNTTASPLLHLDGLMEMTHQQVLKIASAAHELQGHMELRACALSAATRLMITLVTLKHMLNEQQLGKVQAAFCPVIDEYYEQTWEQRVDVSIHHTLQILSKGHAASSPTNSTIPAMTDSSKLKRHIELLCEKLAAGALVPANIQIQRPKTSTTAHRQRTAALTASHMHNPSKLEPIIEDTSAFDANEQSDLGDAEVPVGSTFGAVVTNESLRTISEEEQHEESEQENHTPEHDEHLSRQVSSDSKMALSRENTEHDRLKQLNGLDQHATVYEGNNGLVPDLDNP